MTNSAIDLTLADSDFGVEELPEVWARATVGMGAIR